MKKSVLILSIAFCVSFMKCEKSTGPEDPGGGGSTPFEGCWIKVFSELKNDSGWTDVFLSESPDTVVFKNDTTWLIHSYSKNPFNSEISMDTDFGEYSWSETILSLQTQTDLANPFLIPYIISNDTLKYYPNDEQIGTLRRFFVKNTCTL